MRSVDGITNAMDMSLSKLRTGKPGFLQSTGSQRIRHNFATEQQNVTTKECSKIEALIH